MGMYRILTFPADIARALSGIKGDLPPPDVWVCDTNGRFGCVPPKIIILEDETRYDHRHFIYMRLDDPCPSEVGLTSGAPKVAVNHND